MKVFQPRFQCMKDKKVTVDYAGGYPNEFYPNSEICGYHDFIEMEYFIKGEGTHYINGIPYEVKPGYCYVLFPGDFHRAWLDTEKEYGLWNIKIDVSTVSKELLEEISNFSHPICLYLNKESEVLLREFDFLRDCLHKNLWNSRMVRNIIDRIMTVVHYALKTQSMVVKHTNSNASFWKIIEFVEKNYNRNITLSQIAKLADVSDNYIGTYFKKNTGIKFADYLNRTRLLHAMKLLRETNQTIKEISFSVGFSSPEYLAKLFTATFGVSPSTYRKNLEQPK